jgi:hypothetical protein
MEVFFVSLSLKVNNIDDTTAQWIKEESKRRGIEVEQVILELIHKGLNIERGPAQLQTYHDLDALAGTWNEEQAKEFMNAISDFEKPDDHLWQ